MVVKKVELGTAVLEMRNEDKLSAGKSEWKTTLGRPSR
jgi:hypothetical protein